MRSSALSPADHATGFADRDDATLLHSAWEFPGPIRMGGSIVNNTLRFTIGEDPVDGPDIYEMLDSGQCSAWGDRASARRTEASSTARFTVSYAFTRPTIA